MGTTRRFGYSVDPTTGCQTEGSQEGPGPLWAVLAQCVGAGGCFTADSAGLIQKCHPQ